MVGLRSHSLAVKLMDAFSLFSVFKGSRNTCDIQQFEVVAFKLANRGQTRSSKICSQVGALKKETNVGCSLVGVLDSIYITMSNMRNIMLRSRLYHYTLI